MNFMGNPLESENNLNDSSFLHRNILYWKNISSTSPEVSTKLIALLFKCGNSHV